MKIIVTGATGFIGFNLVKFLIQEGHLVIALVRPSSKHYMLRDIGVEIIDVDLEDDRALRNSIRKADAIFHLAALRGEWGWTREEYQKINVNMAQNLLESSLGNVDHFIYCSSVSVLGHFKNKPADESYPYAPVTNYGRSKCEAEKIVLKFHLERGLPVTIVRPVITYGPFDLTGMMTKLITLINSNRYITVGDGNNQVHLIYIDDLLQGFNLVLRKAASRGEIIIFAGENPITINDLVANICYVLNKRIPRMRIPLKLAKLAGFFMENIYSAASPILHYEPLITRDKVDIMSVDRSYSICRAKSLLGYKPGFDYNQGIRLTVDWLKSRGLIGSRNGLGSA